MPSRNPSLVRRTVSLRPILDDARPAPGKPMTLARRRPAAAHHTPALQE
jgi:hypothetical protein